MSLIQSEPDDSSSSSLSSNSFDGANLVIEQPHDEKVPLSTSIILDRLPQHQQKLIKTIDKHEVRDKFCSEVSKITIRLQSIGSTPVINPRIFKVTSTQPVSTIIKFIMKRLKLDENSVHLYIQNSFQINPDEILADLFQMYKVNNELIISYCASVAFG